MVAQQTPDTAPTSSDVATNAVAALFNKIGRRCWSRIPQAASWDGSPRPRGNNVKAVYSYEPVTQYFPQGRFRIRSVRDPWADHRHPDPAGRLHEADQDPDRDHLGRQLPDR